VEVILKEARDKLDASGFLGAGNSRKIAGYRGGYTPLERKTIERKMIQGELSGLVSTNALELGIDIGKLDTTVIVGYPGTRASFWQQSGRAGRNGETCVNYLILENQPFDQYIAISPDWLFSGESEHAIVDPDNLLIELAHVRAAAAEMPLSLDDIALFPELGEILPVLLEVEEVKSFSGRFSWSGPAFPAGDYSLRNHG
jgi:DEAD/DEAH box helicase domain-containing protein